MIPIFSHYLIRLTGRLRSWLTVLSSESVPLTLLLVAAASAISLKEEERGEGVNFFKFLDWLYRWVYRQQQSALAALAYPTTTPERTPT